MKGLAGEEGIGKNVSALGPEFLVHGQKFFSMVKIVGLSNGANSGFAYLLWLGGND